MIVADSSVLAKWFLDEPDSFRARELLQAHREGRVPLAVPNLGLIELANVLRYKWLQERADEAAFVSGFAIDLLVRVGPTTADLIQHAVGLAYAFDLSVYDAVFVALARELGCFVLTADEELARKAEGLGMVKVLGSYRLDAPS